MFDTIPPILLQGGMSCALPTVQTPEVLSEQLFNWFYLRSRALSRRPGSIFFARLGDGAVAGLYEHEFETGTADAVLCAVAEQALPEAWATADATGEPDAGASHGFFPDVRHGGKAYTFPARAGDRFTFASLYNRVYFAGSSNLPRVRFFDYFQRQFGVVAGLSATGVVGHRGRLYAYGDPYHPNYLYPSNFAEPETFRPELALQVGSSNARILLVLGGLDRLVIFTTAGVSQYDGYDVESGDLELREVDRTSSIVGPRGGCVGGDGFVYWLDPRVGPCRWAVGMAAAETDFAQPMAEVFRRMSPLHRKAATVDYDDVHDAVHFAFVIGEGAGTNYMASFFPGRGWTHSASTTDTTLVGARPLDGGDTQYTGSRGLQPGAVPAGELHTCALSRVDPLAGEAQMLAGDADGYVWRWQAGAPRDKARGAGALGYEFVSLWRSGVYELAALRRVAMVRLLTLDLEAPGNFAFDFRVECDYARRFVRTHQVVVDEYPGQLGGDFLLDESPLARSAPMPRHHDLPMWSRAIGKVLRYELETRTPLLLLGLEHDVARSAR